MHRLHGMDKALHLQQIDDEASRLVDRLFKGATAVEFEPGQVHIPIAIFCRPTARDVCRVLAAWAFGRGLPQPMRRAR